MKQYSWVWLAVTGEGLEQSRVIKESNAWFDNAEDATEDATQWKYRSSYDLAGLEMLVMVLKVRDMMPIFGYY